jgi:hypothetical protein
VILVAKVVLFWVVVSVCVATAWAISYEVARLVANLRARRQLRTLYLHLAMVTVPRWVTELTLEDVQRQDGDAADWGAESLWSEAAPCPACRRIRELHVAHPRLSLDHLFAVVNRQIAEGRCLQHCG